MTNSNPKEHNVVALRDCPVPEQMQFEKKVVRKQLSHPSELSRRTFGP